MLASELPLEIIARFAWFVPREDIIACREVCKAWRYGFESALWAQVKIRDKTHLEYICDLSTDQPNPYQLNGRRTRILHLPPYSYIDKDQFYTLQNHFQEIERLHAPRESLSTIVRNRQSDWSLWKSLKDLRLRLPLTDFYGRTDEIYGVLSYLPNLSRLDITSSGSGACYKNTLEDLETIHRHLPLLRHFATQIDLNDLTANELESITNVTPAKHMECIRFAVTAKDLRWLDYFGRKYPNIHTLELVDNVRITNQQFYELESLKDIYQTQGIFPCLKKLVIEDWLSASRADLGFWNILRHLSLPLNELQLIFTNCKQDQTRHNLDLCIQSFEKTLRSLTFISRSTLPRHFDALGTLGICLWLKDLELAISSIEFAIDGLLDNCRALKNLKISMKKIFILTQKVTIHHPLISLSLSNSDVSAHVFKYISARCPILSSMNLINVYIFGETSQITGHLDISMKYTRFLHLYFNNVFFSTSRNKWCSENAINIMVLSQASVLKACLSTLNVHQSINYGEKHHSSSLWFHTYSSGLSRPSRSKLRVLDKEEVSYAKDYFASYWTRARKEIYSEDVLRSITGQLNKNLWKFDLSRGYTTFYCNHIENYCFEYDQQHTHGQSLPGSLM
ncbi:hypothetical protein CLU79DRAFT_830298 [Phycomyces nitens]|nr:hypothetical protein CLU79DRAFT_830298 [Phycomyces nitens]